MSSSSEYIRIGSLAGAHGLDGRLKVLVISDFDTRFYTVEKVFVCINGFYKQDYLTEFEPYKGKYGLIRLKSVDNRNLADQLAGCDLFISKEEAEKTRIELDADTCYYYDLIDCSVYLKNKHFGIVRDIIEAGAGEILVIADENGKEYMIPFVESMVDISQLDSKRIEIMPVEGLFEEQ